VSWAEAALGPAVAATERTRRFLAEGPLRPPPGEVRWSVPGEVVLRRPGMELRDFSEPGAEGTPMLIVAPEVNGAHIADFGEGQSLVRTVREHGFPRVALTVWRSATEATRHHSVDDSIAAVFDAIDHLGGRVHLLGICQGGWEAAVVAALRPDAVASLCLVAAPIDFHASAGLIHATARATPPAAFDGLVALGGGVMRGDLLRRAFDALRPVQRPWVEWSRLWVGLDDPAFVERTRRLEAWYGAEKNLPGGMYRQAVEELFRENRLVRGDFVVHGVRVDLSVIRCPLALVAGARDHITPPPQVWAAEAAMSPSRVLRKTVDAGHVGVFIGRRALAEDWPPILEWLRG